MFSELKEFVKNKKTLLIVIAVAVFALIVTITVTALLPDYMRLEYTEKADGTLEVTEIKCTYKDGWFCKTSLTVPTEVKGKKVTSINKLDSAKVQTIILPDSITEIKSEAFASDTSLKEIALGNNLKIIGDNAWKNCSSLKNIVLPQSLTNVGATIFDGTPIQYTQENGLNYVGNEQNPYLVLIGAADSSLEEVHINEKTVVAAKSAFETSTAAHITFADTANIAKLSDRMFAGCVNLSEVTLLNATEIGENCFEKCANLQDIDLCPSVTTLKKRCFAETALTQLILPASVTEIDDDAVQGASDLTKLELNNEKYHSENDILYNKEMTKICIIPEGLTETIFSSNFCPAPDNDPSLYFAKLCDMKKLRSITMAQEISFKKVENKNNKEVLHTYTYSVQNGIMYKSDKYNSDGKAIEDITVYALPRMMTNIVLSDKLTQIDTSLFNQCENLQNVSIANSGNITLSATDSNKIVHNYTIFAENGLMYRTDNYTDKNGNTHSETALYYVPKAIEIVVLSDKITVLEANSFVGCNKITSITVSESINKIKAKAFAGLNIQNLAVVFKDTANWNVNGNAIEQAELSDPATAAELVAKTYLNNEWTKD